MYSVPSDRPLLHDNALLGDMTLLEGSQSVQPRIRRLVLDGVDDPASSISTQAKLVRRWREVDYASLKDTVHAGNSWRVFDPFTKLPLRTNEATHISEISLTLGSAA